MVRLGYFSGVSLNKQLASKTTNIETTIFAFDVWNHNKKYEADTVLGLYQFGVHGAHAAPIAVYCTHNGKIKTEKPVTYVQKIAKMTGKDSLLCASGYIPDATKTDCVVDNTNYDIAMSLHNFFKEINIPLSEYRFELLINLIISLINLGCVLVTTPISPLQPHFISSIILSSLPEYQEKLSF